MQYPFPLHCLHCHCLPGLSNFLYLYIDRGGFPHRFSCLFFLVFYCCRTLRVAKDTFIVFLHMRYLNFPSTSCNILNVNPSVAPCGSSSTWVCIHVDFQNVVSALPPWVFTGGNSGFAVEHLTLSCYLSLVCHYKETAAPHSSFSQVTIEMRARNARAVGLDLNSVAVETQRGPNIGRGGSIPERGVGFYCQIFEELPVGGKTRLDLKKSSQGAEKEEQEKWMRRREEWTVLLSAWGQRADAV